MNKKLIKETDALGKEWIIVELNGVTIASFYGHEMEEAKECYDKLTEPTKEILLEATYEKAF